MRTSGAELLPVGLHWNTVRLADVPPQPWKNGGGTTQELARWPEEGDWLWRISVAQVERDGPFSAYPGVQRWFAVLAGEGVVLNDVHLTRTSPPFEFDGALAVDCKLISGRTQDFNLMLRLPASGTVQRVSGSLEFDCIATETIALYSSGARCTARFASEIRAVGAGELAWTRCDAPRPIRVEADDALCVRIRA